WAPPVWSECQWLISVRAAGGGSWRDADQVKMSCVRQDPGTITRWTGGSKAVSRLNFGGVIVNDTPNFRADHMPYGGNRQSGLGREGVRYAMEDMTNIQMVAIRQSR
ncbi:MAG: aldehyde dehydrogenase family protein, partial [Anaerolineales bacterium]